MTCLSGIAAAIQGYLPIGGVCQGSNRRDVGRVATEEGDSAAAARIMLYRQHNGLQPETPRTKERARHIYRQIEAAGYTGMLLVMDEFAFWQDRKS